MARRSLAQAGVDGRGGQRRRLEKRFEGHGRGPEAGLRGLTRARRDIAQRLARGVLAHLADLGMGKTRFEIAVEPEKITATGGDRVEMRISPNPARPLKPLDAIASGGEFPA